MARPVTITIPHELGREEAHRRIRDGFDKVTSKVGLASIDQRWEDDTLHFDARAMGMTAAGTVETGEKAVIVTVVLPALLAGMAEAIKGKVEKESTLLLEKK